MHTKASWLAFMLALKDHWLNKASHSTCNVYQLIHLSSFSSGENAESKCGGSVRSLKFSPSLCESAVWWECRGEVLLLHSRSLWRKTYSNAKEIRRHVKHYVVLSVQHQWIHQWIPAQWFPFEGVNKNAEV